jgi:hypothetical protein
VDEQPKAFPREPIFVPGERVVTRAVLRKDDREERGRRVGPLTGWLARLPRRLGYNLGP